MRTSEFRSDRSAALRIHRIDFEDPGVRARSFGVLAERLADANAWQFAISANEHGRVHGFLTGNTFYIRWLDPEHRLYGGRN